MGWLMTTGGGGEHFIQRADREPPNVALVFGRASAGHSERDAARRDAQLIAAAPDLLAACKAAAKYLNANRPKGDIRKNYDQLVSHEHEAYRPLIDAIAKAEGVTK